MESISDIRNKLQSAETETLPELIKLYSDDDREGVKKLILKAQNKLDRYDAEINRLAEMSKFECMYGEFEFIAGIDEVGRGPLAGPVCACAVILPKNCRIFGVNDSKKLSEKQREELYDEITDKAISYAVGFASHTKIDEINILQATYEAMRSAIGQLNPSPQILLNDAVTIPLVNIKQIPIIKGDAKSISIASASVVAKVTRDRLMNELDKKYPEYDFARNKGYGTAKHIEALKKYGPCEIHRRSFIENFK